MQRAEALLEIIHERGKRGLPLERLYRHLFNPELYLRAYGKIYRNDGAMTPGASAETALREAKAPLRGAGPGTGPMLRSGSPDLARQELAAWAAAVEMTRGVARDAALAAAPARKGRRAGLAVRPRDLSCARAVRAVLTAIRLGHDCYQAVTSEIGKHRNIVDRDRHRPRKSKSPSSFAHATARDTATRIAPAVITMANPPA